MLLHRPQGGLDGLDDFDDYGSSLLPARQAVEEPDGGNHDQVVFVFTMPYKNVSCEFSRLGLHSTWRGA